ncbi:hypothetical protein FACS1894111_01960 [Clostridia bacterium]|nr:hypothetical protein FACS1894111_01960 [Clostridia bacterium]
MNCKKCGDRINTGNIYCASCGRAVQIVPDYSLLEDDLTVGVTGKLSGIKPAQEGEPQGNAGYGKDLQGGHLQGKARPENHLQGKQLQGQPLQENPTPSKKDPAKKKLYLVLGIFAGLLVLLFLSLAFLHHKNNQNFAYQQEKGGVYYGNGEYEKSIQAYLLALKLTDGVTKEQLSDTKLKLATAYFAAKQEAEGIAVLTDLIKEEPDNEAAYEQLIAFYEKKGDNEAVLALMSGVTDENILALFKEYDLTEPIFDPIPGKYGDDITLTLKAEHGTTLYYTLDGSDPTESGAVYETPILLEGQGVTTVKVAAKNEKGLYGPTATGKYDIRYEIPPMPTVTPDGGDFSAPISVRIDVPEGAKAYYTWDGSVPTANSAVYDAAIAVPEGNTILSVILIDKHGTSSNVQKCNFRYYLP